MGWFTEGRDKYPGYRLALKTMAVEPSASYENIGMFLILYVKAGTCYLQKNQGRVPLLAPALVLFDETETLAIHQAVDFQGKLIAFHPKVINSVFDLASLRSTPSPFSATAAQDLFNLSVFLKPQGQRSFQLDPGRAQRMGQMMELLDQELQAQRDSFWPCRSRSFLLEILFFLERLPHEQDSPWQTTVLSPDCQAMDPVLLHLHTHYHQKLTIPHLVRQFHTNRTTLASRFQDSTGQPVMTYLNNLRIRLATSLLRDTTLSISEIHQRVGFRDASHFGRTFRKQTGLTPLEYRKAYCWMPV